MFTLKYSKTSKKPLKLFHHDFQRVCATVHSTVYFTNKKEYGKVHSRMYFIRAFPWKLQAVCFRYIKRYIYSFRVFCFLSPQNNRQSISSTKRISHLDRQNEIQTTGNEKKIISNIIPIFRIEDRFQIRFVAVFKCVPSNQRENYCSISNRVIYCNVITPLVI